MKKIVLVLLLFININYVYAEEHVRFSKCVDGDTIKVFLNKQEVTVRLLAIDTPESVKPNSMVEFYGKEASNYTCNRVKNAKKITLEYDENSDKFDKYDRLLAWVFVDEQLLQTELVENGYAKIAYLYGDYKYIDILKEKQTIAVHNNTGIWNEFEKNKYEKKLWIDIDNVTTNYENKEIIIIVVIIMLFITMIKKLKK